MPLPEGYDVKLERVEETGMANRRVWVYKLKFGRKQKHKKICVDFDGELSNISNPANFDGRSPSDNDDFDWGGVETRDIQVGSDPSHKVKRTYICLEAKDDMVEFDDGEEVELRFIGPANGAAGSVSLHSQSVFRRTDSNQRVWREHTWGAKGSTEVPVAMAGAATDGGDAALDDAAPPLIAFDDAPLAVATLDLATVLDAETAMLEDDAIRNAPVAVVAGLTPERWALVADALEVETVGGLLAHPAVEALSKLRRFV